MSGYPYIDVMRIVASILVVTIHTAPFEMLCPPFDFVLTKIIARLAVPFFFVTSGYFLFKDGYPSLNKVKKTCLSLLKYYFLSIIIYLPVMIYNQYFYSKNILFEMVKDFVVDGMFYHLWYFPAVIIGIVIIVIFKKYFSTNFVMALAFVLYMIGICGDSYYGFVRDIPVLKDQFAFLFQYMDYTRNGIFFAPLFLMIGVRLSEYQPFLTKKGTVFLAIISFLIMSIEAVVVHMMDAPRHDAMYLFLPLVTYFLFLLLMRYKGRRYPRLKTLSLYIYILHPLVIIGVRMFAKLLHIQSFLNQQFIQFIIVCFLTISLSFVIDKVIHHENI